MEPTKEFTTDHSPIKCRQQNNLGVAAPRATNSVVPVHQSRLATITVIRCLTQQVKPSSAP